MRLDEERLEELRSWGERLRRAGGEESGAVGRAILMLVEEIDRLHIELWHARMQPPMEQSVEEPAATVESSTAEEEPVASSLHGRLRRMLRRDETVEPVEPVEQPESDAEREGTTAAQAWIAGLRDQK